MKRGFTLVELLVAVSILSILAAIAITAFKSGGVKARDAKRKTDLRTIAQVLEVYYKQNGSYISGTGECENPPVLLAQYLSGGNIPQDPSGSPYCYTAVDSGASYALYGKLEDCSDPEIMDPPNCSTTPYNFRVIPGDQDFASLPPYPGQPTPTPSFRQVFVTSAVYKGDLGGVAGADQKCETRAAAAGLSGNWKAWISDSASWPASTFIKLAVPYNLVDGTTVASSWDDLVDGELTAPIDKTETGGLHSFINVWTSTRANGTDLALNCSDWSVNSSSVTAYFGDSSQMDSTWSYWNGTEAGCHTEKSLYCFQQ